MSTELVIVGAYLVLLAFSCVFGYDRKSRPILQWVLVGACLTLVYIATTRSDAWNDTKAYYQSFRFFIRPFLEDQSLDYSTHYYGDKGIMLISGLVKSFTKSRLIYFFTFSALTISMLYADLRKYCMVPLLGLLIYVARFYMSRDMMQMRAALAIVIAIYSIRYVERQELWKFLGCIFIAWTMHHSMLFALPLYFLRMIKINKKMIFILLGVAFVVAATMSAFIFSSIADYSAQNEIGETYTMKQSQFTTGKGLLNPMIYYQTFVLLAFTLLEQRLRLVVPYYDTLRDGYLYSTLVLIVLCPFLVLSARISTIFATFEIFILPALPFGVSKKMRVFAIIGVAIVAFGFFYLNFLPMQAKL